MHVVSGVADLQLTRPSILAPVTPLQSIRTLTTSPTPRGIFSRTPTPPAETVQASATPAHPVPAPHDLDAPLTPFQTQIAELETKTLAQPGDLAAHLALLKALLDGGEYHGLTRYYETLALASDPNADTKKAREVLVGSDEAWALFLEGLSRSGRLGEIAAMVRRRDAIVSAVGSTGSSTPVTSAALSTGAVAASTSTLSSASPASTTAGRSSILSSLSGSSSSSSPSSMSTPPPSVGSSPLASTGAAAGTPLSPIYVQLAPPTPQANAWKALRWLIMMGIWGFIILTVMSMVMQSTGLLKAGRGPAEFEPEEGKVVKFSDVHGVEEAKNVSPAW